LFFFFDSKLIFSINETEEPEKEKKYIDKGIYKFLTWLFYRVKKETEKLKQNVETYNRHLEKNLSYHKRFGRIKRKVKDWKHILGKYAREAIQPTFLCMPLILKTSGV
jgi:pyruvate/2-oxoacid:ferredoxin oxidoreductase beta subunit